jgi:8-oxo-dGTP pyrophosphatase MutT (NUDIX family)
MAEIAVVPIEQIEISFAPWEWPFARERRGDIDRHFEQRRRERSGIWNGRVLLLNRHAVEDGVFRGTCFEVDYASFLAWRDWGFPDRTVSNFFAVGAVHTADGAYLLGEMGPHTAAAGLIYFPCGSPEPNDLVAGKVDLLGNVARELKEETGLDIGELEAGHGWLLVTDGGFLGFIKPLGARDKGDELRRRVASHLTAESRPELAAIHIVRGPADISPRMPAYVRAFLTEAWRNQDGRIERWAKGP